MLAAQKGTNRAVKEFGQRLVQDHKKANDELMSIATKRNFQPARDMGDKHKAMQEQLAQLTGQEFDRHFVKHMIEAHQKAITLFRAQASSGKDEELKAFAARTLPVLQEHLKMAQQIQSNLQGGGERPGGAEQQRQGTDRPGGERPNP